MPVTVTRVLLKLSGEVLGGPQGIGIDAGSLERIAAEIASGVRSGVQVAIVLGGGNFLRGADLDTPRIDRTTGDQMGMLATVMNGLAIGAALRGEGLGVDVFSAIPAGSLAQPYSAWRTRESLDLGRAVVLVGGTGNPLFTTDTCASSRAVEAEVGLLLKGTKVDGVYTADPASDPSATRLDRLSYDEALTRGLKVMDLSAFSLCRDHSMPIRVFDMTVPGNIRRAIVDQDLGSLVGPR